jgi:hypothetical protein
LAAEGFHLPDDLGEKKPIVRPPDFPRLANRDFLRVASLRF